MRDFPPSPTDPEGALDYYSVPGYVRWSEIENSGQQALRAALSKRPKQVFACLHIAETRRYPHDARTQQGRRGQHRDKPIQEDNERNKVRPISYQKRGHFRHYGTSAWTSFHDTATHYRRDPSPSGAVNHILVCSLTCGFLKAIGLSIWLRLAQWTAPPAGRLVRLNRRGVVALRTEARE